MFHVKLVYVSSSKFSCAELFHVKHHNYELSLVTFHVKHQQKLKRFMLSGSNCSRQVNLRLRNFLKAKDFTRTKTIG